MKIALRRLVLPLALFLVWAPSANAWSWPVQGPVLQPFAYDEAHPYDAGQHRGIDIGADTAGEAVTAPAAGTVSFAGTVPTSGMCVTIQTSDGYSVTLTHLGSILVAKGAAIAEGEAVGTIGPSGTPEFARPYVHLGIRTTSDPNGYLDPLAFLPAAPTADPTPATAAPAPAVATRSRASTNRRSHTRTRPTHARSQHGRARGRGSRSRSSEPATDESSTAASNAPRSAHGQRTSERPASRLSAARSGDRRHSPIRHRGPGGRTSSWRRPVVEAAAPGPTGLGTGHQTMPPGTHVSPAWEPRTQVVGAVLPLVLNGAAALVAIAAAFATAQRRRTAEGHPPAAAQILQRSRPMTEDRRVRQVA